MRFVKLAVFLGLGVLMAETLSDLTAVRTTDLKADTHHVQGIDFDGSRLWVTSVDKEARKGYLQEFSLADGALVRTVDLTAGERYHPGGISTAAGGLWVPVAEYRKESSAVVQKRSLRTLQLEFEFAVADHIGCVAAGEDVLVGGNWDSRDFYIWDKTGRLIRKVANPAGNGYQDIKFVDGRVVGSGLLADGSGAIDWLEYPSLRLIRRIATGQTSRGVSYSNEGMAIHGGRLLLLPEDSPSRLFEFRL